MIPLKAKVKIEVDVDPLKNEEHALASEQGFERIKDWVDCYFDDVIIATDNDDGVPVSGIYARVFIPRGGGYVPMVTHYSEVLIDEQEMELYKRVSWQSLNK